jgi:hypothetical protein
MRQAPHHTCQPFGRCDDRVRALITMARSAHTLVTPEDARVDVFAVSGYPVSHE